MSQLTALLDANVLYPAPIRDILMQLAVEDLFRAKWTTDIHHEWIEALLSFHLIDLKTSQAVQTSQTDQI